MKSAFRTLSKSPVVVESYSLLQAELTPTNLVPRFSLLPVTLVGSGHVSPRIWEITDKQLGGGADKCEICLYKA